MSIFKELLAIKSFRESKAEIAVRRQRAVLAEAARQRDEAEHKLVQYKDYALMHERQIYAELCTRIVRLREIENVQMVVVDLRDKERRHEEQLKQAEADRSKQATQLDTDKKTHSDASRMKEKFVELAQVFADETLKEIERKEDAEMEEVSETRRDRADWDEQLEEAA